MRWRTRAVWLWLALAGTGMAAYQDLWPVQPDPNVLKSRLASTGDLPTSLQPAVQFEKNLVDILSGAPSEQWRKPLEELTKVDTNADVVALGVADVARTWLARIWMKDLDAVLRRYYQTHVAFPVALEALGKDWPENLKVDPWGQPWVYSLQAPKGFPKEANQRYQLGPTRYPQLLRLEAAVKSLRGAIPWKISVQDVAGVKSLQFTSATTSALIQAGGTVDGCVLLYIGANWALLTGQDQLFTVTF